MPAFASVSRLVLAIIRHDVGEHGLVIVLVAGLIMVLEQFPLLIGIIPQVRPSEHRVQHRQVGEQHGAVHERLRSVIIHHWWGM